MGLESPSFEKKPPENFDVEIPYNSPEIMVLESAFISLVQKLKEKIESGEYDTLISDEVGGRIPTLALRKVFESKNPENKLKTFFVAAGRGELDEKALQTFFKKIKPEVKKALIVTEFVGSGKSILNLAEQTEKGGIRDFDVATVSAVDQWWTEGLVKAWVRNGKMSVTNGLKAEHQFFYGGQDSNAPNLYHADSKLSGVRKIKNFPHGVSNPHDPDPDSVITGAHPERLKDASGFESEQEQEKIKKNIQLAREDVKTLAEKALQEVWK